MRRATKPGYSLILAIMLTTAVTLLVAGIVNQVIVFNRLTDAGVKREQAKLGALSGVQIAIAQISAAENATSKKNKETPSQRSIIPHFMRIINRWQQFEFAKDAQDPYCSCLVYIACEQGKINFNDLFDITKKKFTSGSVIDGQKILQLIRERIPSLHTILTPDLIMTMLPSKKRPALDIVDFFGTDKHKLPQLAPLLFSSPQQIESLYDIFTFETPPKSGLEPLLFSSSLLKIQGLQKNMQTKVVDELTTKLQKTGDILVWPEVWDSLLEHFYGKRYTNLTPVVRGMYAQNFTAPVFSVTSYGKCGSVEVKLYAIVHKMPPDASGIASGYCIKKIYWL